MKRYLLFLGVSLLLSCQSEKKKFEMYEMSEMATLMEDMYTEHQKVKEKIRTGEDLGELPESYLEIHTADFTKESFDGPAFDSFAESYLEAQKKLYAAKDSLEKQAAFEEAVNTCIACHKTIACPGPIPRIKKLLK